MITDFNSQKKTSVCDPGGAADLKKKNANLEKLEEVHTLKSVVEIEHPSLDSGIKMF